MSMQTPSRYTLANLVETTGQKDRGEGFFELENPRTLEINLQGNLAWMKLGSMIAYRGDVKFTREGMLEHGIGKLIKRSITGEVTPLGKAEGNGSVYVADTGKKILIVQLQNEALTVNGSSLLAFEGTDTLKWDVKLMKRAGAAVASHNLTNIRLEGSGMVAITSHFEPITLKVSAGKPIFTDPNATIAWSGNLEPELKIDVSLRTLVGRGSGDSVQLKFSGSEGFVVVQPYEEHFYTSYE